MHQNGSLVSEIKANCNVCFINQGRMDRGHPDGGRQAAETGRGKDPVQPHLQHRQHGRRGNGHLCYASQTEGNARAETYESTE